MEEPFSRAAGDTCLYVTRYRGDSAAVGQNQSWRYRRYQAAVFEGFGCLPRRGCQVSHLQNSRTLDLGFRKFRVSGLSWLSYFSKNIGVFKVFPSVLVRVELQRGVREGEVAVALWPLYVVCTRSSSSPDRPSERQASFHNPALNPTTGTSLFKATTIPKLTAVCSPGPERKARAHLQSDVSTFSDD